MRDISAASAPSNAPMRSSGYARMRSVCATHMPHDESEYRLVVWLQPHLSGYLRHLGLVFQGSYQEG